MANETIATVPADLSTDTNLRRFLLELVERLDLILGFKGDSRYVTDLDLGSALQEAGGTVEQLTRLFNTLSTRLEEFNLSLDELSTEIEKLKELVDNLELSLNTAEVLDDGYLNLNSALWQSLVGKAEITAVGTNFVNPPIALDSALYTMYVSSTSTSSGAWLQLCLRNHSTEELINFTRIGTSVWTQHGNYVTPPAA